MDVEPTLNRRAQHMAEEPDEEEENSDDDKDEEEDDVVFSTQGTFSCAKKVVDGGKSNNCIREGGGVEVATTYRFELAVREYDGPDAKCVSGKLFVATPTTTAGTGTVGLGATRSDATAEAPANKKARVEKETQVGLLEAYLVKRPCGCFYEVCDSVSAELQHISTTFCDDEGRASRVNHPALQSSKAAVQGGGLLQIYIVELQHSHRGADVGLRMVHETLMSLRTMWTLTIVVPCPLSGAFRKFEDPSYRPVSDKISNILTQEEEQAHSKATVKVQKHFARLGFLQAGRTPALAEFFFATRDSYFKGRADPWNRLLSRDQVGALDLYTKPAPHHMKDVDKELRMLLERHAMNASGNDALQQFFLAAGVMRTDRVPPPSGSSSAVLSKMIWFE
jgi:hypothetical protein